MITLDTQHQNKPINLSANASFLGSTLSNNHIQVVTGDDGSEAIRTIDTSSSGPEGYVVSDWQYQVNSIRIRVVNGSNLRAKPIGNFTLHIGGIGVKCFHFMRQAYVQGSTTFYLQLWTGNRWTFDVQSVVYLCDGIKTDKKTGEINIGYTLQTGITEALSLKNVEESGGHAPTDLLQLTGSGSDNREDLYVSAVRDDSGIDGLRISAKPMKNIKHTITMTRNVGDNSDSHPYNYSVTNTDCQWNEQGIGTANLECFIPLKTNEFPIQLGEGSERLGWFIINDMNGFVADHISDRECEVYIATGHQSLNVEPAGKDDTKFKTFNGTLVFDRSNTKITQLFSNDTTGTCIGYINDILAARLSRYYYCCNYNVFNSFLNTEQTLGLSRDPTYLDGVYKENEFYTGYHEVWMSNCQDIVKLIGSENVVNNCMNSLQPEEHVYDCLVTYNAQYEDSQFPPDHDSREEEEEEDTVDYPRLYYKFFHYYTSGLMDYPYAGIGPCDSDKTTVGGLNLMYVPKKKEYDNNILANTDNWTCNDVSGRVCEKPLYVFNRASARTKNQDIYQTIDDTKRYYDNNELKDYGFIETLPVFRLYRNANFEQTDLTITTGGIKLLHPIYLQSTPRVLINNLLYMFDTIIENLLNKYGGIVSNDNTFGFLSVYLQSTDDGIDEHHLTEYNGEYPLLRFGNITFYDDGVVYNIGSSLDSLCLLNYLQVLSINEYQSTDELIDSLPNAADNEEVIKDMITNSMETNAQLFSYKYFKFSEEITQFARVIFTSRYVDVVPVSKDMLSSYYVIKDQSNYNDIVSTIQGYINKSDSYNNLKSCKIFICKLGEFLDYPRMLYACSESQPNSINISVYNRPMNENITPIKTDPIIDDNPLSDTYNQLTGYQQSMIDLSDQKVNTYLFGTVFRYHQLSHGYQNFPNEVKDDFIISKSLGNRTFVITLYDEFGRRFPNVDTNQGFRNRLYMEIYLT